MTRRSPEGGASAEPGVRELDQERGPHEVRGPVLGAPTSSIFPSGPGRCPRQGRGGSCYPDPRLWASGTQRWPPKCLLPSSLQLQGGRVSGGHNPFPGPLWGRRQGSPGSPSPPLALFIGDGQEIPSAVQVHQGPGMGEDMVSARGPEHTTPEPPGMFLGDKGWVGRGVWAD